MSIKEIDTILKSLDNRTKDTLQRLVDDNLAVAHWGEFCKDVKSMFESVLGKVQKISHLKVRYLFDRLSESIENKALFTENSFEKKNM